MLSCETRFHPTRIRFLIDFKKRTLAMSNSFIRQIFLNLPVKDLKKSMAFFRQLGFEFNQQFTDDNAACMIISEQAYVMLLVPPFFQTFTNKQLPDPETHTGAIFALSCPNRAAVNDMVNQALAAGGTPALDAKDHGFMYAWSFYDVDGHHWEVMWMDPAAVAPQN